MTYNGWTNYETWLVNLWRENEEPSYRFWRARATEVLKQAPQTADVARGQFSVDDAARLQLANELREWVEEANPIQEPTVYSDLLNAALAEVNWLEIAGHLVADVTEK